MKKLTFTEFGDIYIRQTRRFDDVVYKESNGLLFALHWRYRFDPIVTPTVAGLSAIGGGSALTGTAITAMAAGTAMSAANTLKEGKDAQKIANARAAVDLENAKAARNASVEKARITNERGRRLLATQKAEAAAGGIKINEGSPLVIEAQTRRDINTDVGFILEHGRAEENYYKSSAAMERAYGKSARKRSKYSAWSQGLLGAGSIAFMGKNAGTVP